MKFRKIYRWKLCNFLTVKLHLFNPFHYSIDSHIAVVEMTRIFEEKVFREIFHFQSWRAYWRRLQNNLFVASLRGSRAFDLQQPTKLTLDCFMGQ